MKFRYYIVFSEGGSVLGTNDEVMAADSAMSDALFVIDAQNGIWMAEDRDEEIREVVA